MKRLRLAALLALAIAACDDERYGPQPDVAIARPPATPPEIAPPQPAKPSPTPPPSLPTTISRGRDEGGSLLQTSFSTGDWQLYQHVGRCFPRSACTQLEARKNGEPGVQIDSLAKLADRISGMENLAQASDAVDLASSYQLIPHCRRGRIDHDRKGLRQFRLRGAEVVPLAKKLRPDSASGGAFSLHVVLMCFGTPDRLVLATVRVGRGKLEVHQDEVLRKGTGLWPREK